MENRGYLALLFRRQPVAVADAKIVRRVRVNIAAAEQAGAVDNQPAHLILRRGRIIQTFLHQETF